MIIYMIAEFIILSIILFEIDCPSYGVLDMDAHVDAERV